MWKKEDKFLSQFSSCGPQRKQCRIFSLRKMEGSIIFQDFQKIFRLVPEMAIHDLFR